MQSFRPAPVPAWKKMVLHPAFHITLLVLVFTGTYLLIRHNQKRELDQRVQFLRSGPVIIQQTERKNIAGNLNTQALEEAIEKDSDDSELASNVAPPPPPPPPQAAGVVAISAESSPSSTSTTLANEAERRNSDITLKITIGEYAKSAQMDLLNDLRAAGEVQRFESAFWGNIPASKASNLRINSYSQVQRKFSAQNPSQSWFIGHRNPESESEVGLGFYIALGEAEGETNRAEFEVMRSFRETPGGAILRKSYPIFVEMAAQQSFILSNFLPRKVDLAQDEDLGPDGNMIGLFRIFRSSNYNSGQTESILLLEFQRGL